MATWASASLASVLFAAMITVFALVALFFSTR